MIRYVTGLHPGLQEVFLDFAVLLICCCVLELLLQKLRAIAFMRLLHREKLTLPVAEQIVLPYSILIWPAYSIEALALFALRATQHLLGCATRPCKTIHRIVLRRGFKSLH